MDKQETVRFMVVACLIVFMSIVSASLIEILTSTSNNLVDKPYQLCLAGIENDSLTSDAESDCLKKFGVEITEK